ncbi:hypothetical protein QYM36_000549, partial [Artemia franciscana]
CSAKILISDSRKLIDDIHKTEIPQLKAIIFCCGKDKIIAEEKYYSWARLLEIGKAESQECLMEAKRGIKSDSCCLIHFEEESKGIPPKGVKLSHQNILESITAIQDKMGLEEELANKGKPNRILSVMPISHVNALMTDIYIPLLKGWSVYFEDITEKDFHLIKSLKLVRPLYFFASPVLLEIINDFISDARIVRYKNISTKLFFGTFSSERKHRLRKLAGMDKCKKIFCIGGQNSKISDHVFNSLLRLGFHIQEVFGCSETCGPHLWAEFKAKEGWVFTSHSDQKASILEKSELVLSGKNIFLGYLGDEEATNKAIKDDGYHTGHIIKSMKTRDFYDFEAKIENEIKKSLPFVHYTLIIKDEEEKCIDIILYLKTLREENERQLTMEHTRLKKSGYLTKKRADKEKKQYD